MEALPCEDQNSRKEAHATLSYEGKVLLAPMVRVCTLPFRMLCAKYGAQVVFTEELIAQKLVKTERVVDEERGVVQYVLTEQHGKAKNRKLQKLVVFSTLVKRDGVRYPEGAPLVLQLGTNNAAAAVQAAKHVEQDIDGVDVNMGCPKAFSVKGGMGAALLEKPQVVKDILENLVRELRVPVSCKIRLLEDRERTKELLRIIAASGVHAVTIHSRYPPQRSSTPPMHALVGELVRELGGYPIPIILSGDMYTADISQYTSIPGVKGVMVARGALQNPGVFQVSNPPSKIDAHRELLRYHLKYGGGFRDVKYTLTRSFQELKEYRDLHDRMQSMGNMEEAWNILFGGGGQEELAELIKAYVPPQTVVDGVLPEVAAKKRPTEEEDAEGACEPPHKKPKG